MTRFFTSDLHLNHAPIIGYCDRPFDTVEEMNAALIARWNAVVHEQDEVWVNGDVALGRDRGAALLEIIPQLRGHKILLPGNHDFCWDGRHAGATLEKWIGVYTDAGFDIRDNEEELFLSDGTVVDLCHFPYSGDHLASGKIRYAEFRPKDRGRWLLHGHIHEKWLQRGRQINVGVDVWDFTPVPEAWIMDMIRRGEQNHPPIVEETPTLRAEDIVIDWVQHS